jgi:hypothetical protein
VVVVRVLELGILVRFELEGEVIDGRWEGDGQGGLREAQEGTRVADGGALGGDRECEPNAVGSWRGSGVALNGEDEGGLEGDGGRGRGREHVDRVVVGCAAGRGVGQL